MTRQSRTLLIIGFLAVGGVVALGVIANRYSVVLQRRQASATTGGSRAAKQGTADLGDPAMRQVDAFIEVRGVVEKAVAQGVDPGEALDRVRREALSAARVREADYLQVLDLCRAWRRGNEERTPRTFRQAFERRREQIEALKLD